MQLEFFQIYVKLLKLFHYLKKDNELLCENYRPISVLARMYSFLTENNLIYDRQFGFRSKHSTNHALINLTEDIESYMDRGYIAAGVFINLQNAFDTVNHQILCRKVNLYI